LIEWKNIKMKNWLKRVPIIFLGILLLNLSAFGFKIHAANLITLDDKIQYYSVGKNLKYLVDSKRALSIDDVRTALIKKQFKNSSKNNLSFGYTDARIWLHFELNNPYSGRRKIYLEQNEVV